jgi:hypothetical protein
MPANFITYPNSSARVFGAAPQRTPRHSNTLVLDAATLRMYGTIAVPGHIWRAMQRFGAWIEPVLTAEWARMMRSYGERMGLAVSLGAAERALVWLEPARDTSLARQVARNMIDGGRPVRCVWTGARLRLGALDIDHCLPWSAWPCGDLWNLLPASPRVNQHLKRDRLPSAAALAGVREAVIGWWAEAWQSDAALDSRFAREVEAALPVVPGSGLEDVFAGLEWRRLRLRQDQQVEEWAGVTMTPEDV